MPAWAGFVIGIVPDVLVPSPHGGGWHPARRLMASALLASGVSRLVNVPLYGALADLQVRRAVPPVSPQLAQAAADPASSGPDARPASNG